MKKEQKLTTANTIFHIFMYFLVFMAGDLISSLFFDFIFLGITLSNSEFYALFRKTGCLIITVFLYWIYTRKVLHMEMKNFGISIKINKWCVWLSVLLPAIVIICFSFISEVEVKSCSIVDLLITLFVALISALKAGITEEMLFRGFIMRLVEKRWNRIIAIVIPSFVFSLVHIPSMENITIEGILLLIAGGTLAGIMFSLTAYKEDSIANSVIMHTLWNFAIISNVLHITTNQGRYGNPIISLVMHSDNPIITGEGFGMEASIIAIIGYVLVCIGIKFIPKCERNSEVNTTK